MIVCQQIQLPTPFQNSSHFSSILEVLTLPKPVEKKRVAAKIPSDVSSDEVIRILKDKKQGRRGSC